MGESVNVPHVREVAFRVRGWCIFVGGRGFVSVMDGDEADVLRACPAGRSGVNGAGIGMAGVWLGGVCLR